MKCIKIEDTGVITICQMVPETEEEKIEFDRQFEIDRKWWEENGCHCKDKNEIHHILVDDDEDPNLPKHHWICPRCGGVVQIG